ANWSGAAKQQELKRTAAETAVAANGATIQVPPAADARSTTGAGFLRAMPVRVADAGFLRAVPTPVAAADNLSLFARFYNAPPSMPPQAAAAAPGALRPAAGGNGTASLSFQRVFQRRVVPGQTGLTLQDYRVN